jgi:O-antigen ligase
VLLTLTRSVWIGTVVGTLVVVLLLPSLRRRALLLAAGAASALGLVLWTVPALTERVLHRATTEGSVYDRQNTNAAALRVIAEHPLDGLGWTRFLTQGTDWVRQADTYPVTNVDIEVHNVVLARAAELGLPGAVLWVACVLAGPGLAFLRRPADPDLAGWRVLFCAYASVWLVCTMVSPVPYVLANNLLWLLAGTLLAGHLTRSGPPPVTEPATEPATPAVKPAVTSPDPAVPAAMGR